MPIFEIAGRRPSLADDGSNWIAPSADVIGDARLGHGVSVWFSAVIRADNTPITVGDRTNIQDGAILHSDPGTPLTIGTGCTIGHNVILHGCTIGNDVLIGMGATIMNGSVIGDGCLIGANALITEGKIFPPKSLIIGSPAKVVRELTDEDSAVGKVSAASYTDKLRHYREDLKRLD